MDASRDMDVIQGPCFYYIGSLAIDQSRQIIIVNKFFLIADFLEATENGSYLCFRHAETKVSEAGCDGRPTAVLCQRQFRLPPTDLLRVDDLISLALFQNAVLVNSAGMSKGVLSHNGFTPLYCQTAHSRDKSGRLHDFMCLDAGFETAKSI